MLAAALFDMSGAQVAPGTAPAPPGVADVASADDAATASAFDSALALAAAADPGHERGIRPQPDAQHEPGAAPDADLDEAVPGEDIPRDLFGGGLWLDRRGVWFPPDGWFRPDVQPQSEAPASTELAPPPGTAVPIDASGAPHPSADLPETWIPWIPPSDPQGRSDVRVVPDAVSPETAVTGDDGDGHDPGPGAPAARGRVPLPAAPIDDAVVRTPPSWIDTATGVAAARSAPDVIAVDPNGDNTAERTASIDEVVARAETPAGEPTPAVLRGLHVAGAPVVRSQSLADVDVTRPGQAEAAVPGRAIDTRAVSTAQEADVAPAVGDDDAVERAPAIGRPAALPIGMQEAGTEAPQPAALAAVAAGDRETAAKPDASDRAQARLAVEDTIADPVQPSERNDSETDGDRRSGSDLPRDARSERGAPIVRQIVQSAPAVLASPAPSVESAADGLASVARLAAPEAGALPGGSGRETLQQLVQAIRLQHRNGIGDAVVRLHPQHLGAVSIALRVEHGVVSATLHAEHPAVRQWLESQQGSLRQGLSSHGLQLDRFVVQREGEEPGRRQQPGADARRHAARWHRATPTATFEIMV